jgi:UPF0716 protein FxsA
MQSPLRLVAGLVLLALPLLEVALLIKLGQSLGFWPVVIGVLVTGILGVRLIRTQGLATVQRVSDALARDEEPHSALADGALKLLSGILLLLPGPLTDIAGLALLVPPLRGLLASVLFRNAVFVTRGPRPAASKPGHEADERWRQRTAHGERDGGAGTVIDGEFERLDERPLDPRRVGPKPSDTRPPRPE